MKGLGWNQIVQFCILVPLLIFYIWMQIKRSRDRLVKREAQRLDFNYINQLWAKIDNSKIVQDHELTIKLCNELIEYVSQWKRQG